jgi:hypothetical protein
MSMTLQDLYDSCDDYAIHAAIADFVRGSKSWPKMTKAVKKRWVKALRSGEYAQCKEQLVQVDRNGHESFCCLGVVTHEEGTGDWHLSENGNVLRYRDRNGKRGRVACTVDLNKPGYVYVPAGITLSDLDPDRHESDFDWEPPEVADRDIDPGLRDKIGLHNLAANALAKLNDAGFTFDQLAFLINEYL